MLVILIVLLIVAIGWCIERTHRLDRTLKELQECYLLDKEEMNRCMDIDYDREGTIKAMRFKKKAS
ncbi:MAG TPA: hypothetical protein VJ742_06715 [Nitrososphaera sp.]|nr:hypothetical protein [Nitrososphaera sp.]